MGMTQFIPFSRDQAFLLPPDAKDELWPNLGDGGVRKAAYRGGWKPA